MIYLEKINKQLAELEKAIPENNQITISVELFHLLNSLSLTEKNPLYKLTQYDPVNLSRINMLTILCEQQMSSVPGELITGIKQGIKSFFGIYTEVPELKRGFDRYYSYSMNLQYHNVLAKIVFHDIVKSVFKKEERKFNFSWESDCIESKKRRLVKLSKAMVEIAENSQMIFSNLMTKSANNVP